MKINGVIIAALIGIEFDVGLAGIDAKPLLAIFRTGGGLGPNGLGGTGLFADPCFPNTLIAGPTFLLPRDTCQTGEVVTEKAGITGFYDLVLARR